MSSPTIDQDEIVMLRSEIAYLRGKVEAYEKFLKDSPIKIELSVNRKEIAKLKDEIDDIIEKERMVENE